MNTDKKNNADSQVVLSGRLPNRPNRADGVRDPFAGITGIVDSLETDLAARVDEIYD